ncbi:hypothetical protein MBM_03891 [Drepanopeziza brunnea f. sp. 'multigermtubi' MB_m1]|uniref:Uncharacterized protein n=1 Tax=Marssonina brunnea f. sp. multigermtubi (strain MB_m1) TaxID=1072389 RepID=K1XZ88_MARBU|nr:uncharacterized protein MBM_03891 [Drepanopeziza brunnea f. sp. 'multigermtubi' MB_m1]EKD18119.1 hypothetical protein MBM_03891 [Drepanopeziza brunnea f. sp. 'multigermtubi' MB_m1]
MCVEQDIYIHPTKRPSPFSPTTKIITGTAIAICPDHKAAMYNKNDDDENGSSSTVRDCKKYCLLPSKSEDSREGKKEKKKKEKEKERGGHGGGRGWPF